MAEQKLTGTQIGGMIAMALGTLVIANDFTALSVALPVIEKDFNADVTTVQWVITGYALVFGVWIVTGGRLADMFGRRRIFIIGMVIFAVFSLIGGLATNVWILLVARGLMGIGGSMVWPAVLGLMYGLVPEEKASLAGGVIMAVAGFGNALGPLLGGGFTEYLSWRWVFYINVPVALFAIFTTLWAIPADSPDNPGERIDYPGIVALSFGLFGILLMMDVGADVGWFDPPILALFVASLISLALFLFIERRSGVDALVPDDVMGNSEFTATLIATLMMSAIYFGALLYLPQFMMKILGYSATEAGVGLLPLMGMFAITSFFAAALYDRLGAKAVVSLGALCLAAGIFMISAIAGMDRYLDLMPGMIVIGIGVGLFYSAITTAGITSLDPSRASLAGAVIFMVQNAGGAIGLGLNTAIVVTAPTLAEGISRAFVFDGTLAIVGLLVCLFRVGGPFTGMKLFARPDEEGGE